MRQRGKRQYRPIVVRPHNPVRDQNSLSETCETKELKPPRRGRGEGLLSRPGEPRVRYSDNCLSANNKKRRFDRRPKDPAKDEYQFY